MKTLLLVVAFMAAITSIAKGQDAKANLRDFTPKYSIDTFSIKGEASYVKRRVIQLQNGAGIRSAYWDDVSSLLTVQYNDRLIQPQAIKHFFINNQALTSGHQAQKPRFKGAFVCCLVSPHFITSKK